MDDALDLVEDERIIAELEELLRDREEEFSEAVASYLRALEHLVSVQGDYLLALVMEGHSEEEKSDLAVRLMLARKRKQAAQDAFIKAGTAVMEQ